MAIAKNPTVIILGFHPRDSGSSPDSGIFFCFLRPRACVRAPARVWGPWGLYARAARVWGFWGVFCLWGFGAGWGAPWGVWRAGDEGGGWWDCFFFAEKGPTGPVSAGPAGPRRDHAGAKARPPEGQPRRRVAACRGGILPLRREQRAVGHECDRFLRHPSLRR